MKLLGKRVSCSTKLPALLLVSCFFSFQTVQLWPDLLVDFLSAATLLDSPSWILVVPGGPTDRWTDGSEVHFKLVEKFASRGLMDL